MLIEVAQQVFDGVMLSDGGLYFSSNRSINAHFHMSLSGGSKHMDWLAVIKENFLNLGVDVSQMYPKLGVGYSRGKRYIYSVLDSRVSEMLTEQHFRWYKDNIKAVPSDFHLTPIVLANWFMGDGSARIISSSYVEVRFATQGFSEDEVRRLISQLNALGVYGTHYYSDVSGFVIDIATIENVDILMDLVESHMLSSFKYKMLRPRRAKLRVIEDRLGRMRLNRRI